MAISSELARADTTQDVRVGIHADSVKTQSTNHTHRRDRFDANGRSMAGSLGARDIVHNPLILGVSHFVASEMRCLGA